MTFENLTLDMVYWLFLPRSKWTDKQRAFYDAHSQISQERKPIFKYLWLCSDEENSDEGGRK